MPDNATPHNAAKSPRYYVFPFDGGWAVYSGISAQVVSKWCATAAEAEDLCEKMIAEASDE